FDCCYMFLFFQAEDGIRDRNVTGVQTCALPISRTVGLTPFQRVRPAFPTRTNSCSMFPTCPTVARQVDNTKRTSPELKRTNVYFPSRPRICAPAPAERTNCPPAP